jgi:DNA-binding Lrp family transcriptional regulator
MDDTDRRLLALLRDDARLPVATLARALGVSRATVQNRIARLRREGVIQGFTLRVRPDAEGRRVRAVMLVAIEGKSSQPVVRALRALPEVAAVHTTNGRWDLVVELRTEGLEQFDQALGRIRSIDGVAQTETSLLLSSIVL